ncbi:hypothetical protein BLOT_007564 [Blomia tropicalis]|nr:hypothetical protein BLOT_007564 [Blomia tropicalis]
MIQGHSWVSLVTNMWYIVGIMNFEWMHNSKKQLRHTCVKEDLKRSAVELVYETKLRLPAAFPSLNQTTTENEDEFTENLQK